MGFILFTIQTDLILKATHKSVMGGQFLGHPVDRFDLQVGQVRYGNFTSLDACAQSLMLANGELVISVKCNLFSP